ISPHLDDAVLSCAHLLAAHPGSLVVSVFAGGPRPVDPLPPWEATSGCFRAGDDVVGLRRAEDDAALRVVGASGRHLGLWDFQYRDGLYGYADPPEGLETAATAAIAAVLDDAPVATWLVPLGILHPDHVIATSATLRIARQRPELTWLVYEELPYALAYARERAQAVERLEAAGFGLVATSLEAAEVDKAAAVGCYVSQLPILDDLGMDSAVTAAEIVHRLLLP
ncbi:MAG TPA: PIG-L family deacetylase, partial [Candidatus Sulfotelmatobacter sp.]|nr:PIG-L family deacetylase [Candidatus Sulfotelmatobacter sp.]